MRLFRCPRCHQGKLYKGLLSIADHCTSCGLSFKGHEEGDGPTVLTIFVIGTISTVGAAVLEIKYQIAFAIQAAIWGPFIILGSIFCLRVLKAALISTQYQVRKEDFN